MGRPADIVGAHTKQHLMNWRSIGICCAGNLNLQGLTKWQVKGLRILLTYLQLKHGIRNGHIRPHDVFASYKACPGEKLKEILDKVLANRNIRKKLRHIPPENDFIPE